MTYRAGEDFFHLAAGRLPGADGVPMDVEIPRWNHVGPRYGLKVIGPPIPPE